MAQLLQRKVAAVIMLMGLLMSCINIALSCCATPCVTGWVNERSWAKYKNVNNSVGIYLYFSSTYKPQ